VLGNENKANQAEDSERLYSSILDNTDDGFQLVELIYAGEWVTDYRFLRVNAAYEKQTGLKGSDVVGKNIRQFDPAIESYWFYSFKIIDKTGRASHLLYYNKKTKRWYDVYSFSYAEGKIGSLFRDVTEHKKAEETISKKEEEFRTLVQASYDVVYRMSADWAEMSELHGKDFIPDTEKPSRTWLEKYIHPDDQSFVLAFIKHAIDTKSDFKLEHRVVLVDGSLGWTSSHAIPIMDKYGAITEWLGTAKDITESKRAEEALRRSEELFRTFVTASWDVVYRMSADWKEMRYLHGQNFISDTNEPSRTWLDKYIHPDDQKHVWSAIQRAIETKSVFELEHRVIRVDGTLGWTLSRAIPILDEDGGIVEWLGAAKDVTERKTSERKLLDKERKHIEIGRKTH
jgi:PAS domain S-box-containing protein